ncbi:MAG: malonyl-CoA decarboxylase [Hyphomicrobiales bacterium]|nr:malonyl-CoA decarboxylase [Hyphomicrobiales bacterium]
MLSIISERSRHLVPWIGNGDSGIDIVEITNALLSEKGGASSIAIAIELFHTYSALSSEQRLDFFLALAEQFCADIKQVEKAANAFLLSPSGKSSALLHTVTESRRQELFRRLNHAPGGTKLLVQMRQDLLGYLAEHSDLKSDLAGVDADFVHLFSSWFNRGFLVLERITWATPATILEKIIEYEAVHEIDSWDELRRRIQPADRRCYAFFHPALGDDPLIFVEVALTGEISDSVGKVLAADREPVQQSKINTAVFYSISNCQEGLKKVSFGNFLIKQVVEELARELPQVKTFVTLSPIPGFMKWFKRNHGDTSVPEFELTDEDQGLMEKVESGEGSQIEKFEEEKKLLMPLAAAYLIRSKTSGDRSLDPVAQFHLGNGAKLERLNWAADLSSRGLAQSAGMMVNYLYERDEIIKNHQSYENGGKVAASSSISKLVRNAPFKLGTNS